MGGVKKGTKKPRRHARRYELSVTHLLHFLMVLMHRGAIVAFAAAGCRLGCFRAWSASGAAANCIAITLRERSGCRAEDEYGAKHNRRYGFNHLRLSNWNFLR
jgi:hypothetical protein